MGKENDDNVLKALEDIQKALKGEEKGTDDKKSSKVKAPIDAEKLVKEMTDKIVEAVQEAKGWQKEDDSENLKKKIFGYEKPKGQEYPELKDLGNLTDEETIVLFVKALAHQGRDANAAAIVKGLAEGTNADGGYLVPEPLAVRVYEILPDLSVMRNLADVIPMSSETLRVNFLQERPQAYWIGERQTKTTTSAEFGQVTLTANKLVARMLVSDELVADANINIVQWIVGKFAEAIAVAEDRAFFTGSGTGQPKGITTESLTTVSKAGATLSFDDIISLMYAVSQATRNGRQSRPAFVAHAKVIQQLQKVKDSSGQYIWGPGLRRGGGETERLPDTIYGFPLYEQNDLPQDRLYFGDWSKYVIGDRQQIAVESTRQNETAWTQDATDIKAVERVDGRVVMTRAFAVLNNI